MDILNWLPLNVPCHYYIWPSYIHNTSSTTFQTKMHFDFGMESMLILCLIIINVYPFMSINYCLDILFPLHLLLSKLNHNDTPPRIRNSPIKTFSVITVEQFF